jgi:hypothetical protein
MKTCRHRSSIRETSTKFTYNNTRFRVLKIRHELFSGDTIPYLEMSVGPLIPHIFLKQVQFELYVSVQSGWTVKCILLLALETIGQVWGLQGLQGPGRYDHWPFHLSKGSNRSYYAKDVVHSCYLQTGGGCWGKQSHVGKLGHTNTSMLSRSTCSYFTFSFSPRFSLSLVV